VLYLAGDHSAGVDPSVSVGDEREVHDLEEAVHEDLGEVLHHEARRVGAQRLVVQRHGHLLGPLLAGRGGGSGGEQEERGDGEAGGHWVGTVDRSECQGRRGGVMMAVTGLWETGRGELAWSSVATLGPHRPRGRSFVSHEQRPWGSGGS